MASISDTVPSFNRRCNPNWQSNENCKAESSITLDLLPLVCFLSLLRYKIRWLIEGSLDLRKGFLEVKLKDELLRIVTCLDNAGVDYALCGGLAVAVHGHPRLTKDIDILIRFEALEAAKAALAAIEYDLESGLFRFHPKTDKESLMYRVSRAEGTELVTLDLMLVAPVFESVWNDRESISIGDNVVKVVSKNGLIRMKSVSGRPQDLADIDALQRMDDE